MSENRKEEIIMATLKLASVHGLRAVSMSMIAKEVGIKKPSLYNHFKSKEELVCDMYLFLKNKAQKETRTQMDLSIFDKKSAYEILSTLVNNYVTLSSKSYMQMFYKVIYSERAISREASRIMVVETEKMIDATNKVFNVLKNKNLLKFENLEINAISFALTIHSIIDYSFDKCLSENKKLLTNFKLIDEFISNFCNEHKC